MSSSRIHLLRTTRVVEGGWRTYGLMGSLSVSRKSSILLVCSLMASRGLGSLDMSVLGAPKVCWFERL